jgi:hypothetical protein
MHPLNLVAISALPPLPDAVMPQSAPFSESSCQFLSLSAIVHAGRTQAVCTSRRGPACREALQEHRSRGCRARKSFCRCAWLPLLQLAQVSPTMTSSMWTSLFRSNRPTPANTSKTIGRAFGAVQARPALFLSFAPAETCFCTAWPFVLGLRSGYVEGSSTNPERRFSCGNLHLSPLWRLPPLPLARSPRLSRRLPPSPLSRPRRANTAPNLPERARRGDRPVPVPTLRAATYEVRPC